MYVGVKKDIYSYNDKYSWLMGVCSVSLCAAVAPKMPVSVVLLSAAAGA